MYKHELRFLFQDEETKDGKKEDKRKTIFISPFMRYKCVIPMIMDQEAKEREKQEQKKEEKEEESSAVKIKDECINEAEINESKNRVYEHFKQISQTNKRAEIPPKKKKRSKQFILSQIHGRKRKREFDIRNENRKKDDNEDFSAPTSCLNAGTAHVSKKAKRETQETVEERKVQENLAQVQGDNKLSETIKSIR